VVREVGIMDNFLRLLLTRRGANLPRLLIFAGAIGGLIALGVIGLFVGPVVLAVAFTLLEAWMEDSDRPSLRVDQPRAKEDDRA
jgi:predicted PurR-regulated permease PerM